MNFLCCFNVIWNTASNCFRFQLLFQIYIQVYFIFICIFQLKVFLAFFFLNIEGALRTTTYAGCIMDSEEITWVIWVHKPVQIPQKTADGSSFPVQAAWSPRPSSSPSSHKPVEKKRSSYTHTQVKQCSDGGRGKWKIHAGIYQLMERMCGCEAVGRGQQSRLLLYFQATL